MKRKWNASKAEKYAEKYWEKNGYAFEIKHQYISRTDYIVSKDGFAMPYSISSDITDPKGDMKNFEKCFGMYKILKNEGMVE